LLLAPLAWMLAAPPCAVATSLATHENPRIRALWTEGEALERQDEFAESSRRYERIAEALPDSATVRWRLARNYWRVGESLDTDDKRGRLHFFALANRWADDSLAANEDCAECCLWKGASLGRLATTRGVMQAAGAASTIAEIFERGIALRPTHRDGPDSSTLGNLYYAAATFYRIVPDWWWLAVVIGVRGDNHRALRYIESAIELHPMRVDYQVERGAILLCIGSHDGDEERIEQGRIALAESVGMQDVLSTDAMDRDHARILIAEPDKACGYSRDGWIDLSEAAAGRR